MCDRGCKISLKKKYQFSSTSLRYSMEFDSITFGHISALFIIYYLFLPLVSKTQLSPNFFISATLSTFRMLPHPTNNLTDKKNDKSPLLLKNEISAEKGIGVVPVSKNSHRKSLVANIDKTIV